MKSIKFFFVIVVLMVVFILFFFAVVKPRFFAAVMDRANVNDEVVAMVNPHDVEMQNVGGEEMKAMDRSVVVGVMVENGIMDKVTAVHAVVPMVSVHQNLL